ncbi:thioesterase II family protein [Paenibacillus methanolicus]|uniref:thioesterase II family protein n=1 Tax=Paenibacillus methanolicus TaxID=582686 RepID=UPI001652E51C|nr:alpha/beta fold hydrolase [Paenibacillus methanolicus]
MTIPCTLFCFPYAGGAAAEFLKWQAYAHDSITIVPVDLAGKGSRKQEPFCSTMEEAVADAYTTVTARLDGQPYAIFGHSMGAILAFELARRIRQQSAYPSPDHLFVSGRNPPHVPRRAEAKVVHELDDDAFIEEITQFGGIPEDLLAHRKLLRLFVPILRKEYEVSERYVFRPNDTMLDCDISVLYGTEDHSLPEIMSQWQRHTTGRIAMQAYEGGHFFIHEHGEQVVQRMNAQLLGLMAARP